MTVQERVCLCRLIEKIDRDLKHAKSIGVKNVSKLRKNGSGILQKTPAVGILPENVNLTIDTIVT